MTGAGSRTRLWTFRLVSALAAPLILFAGLEIGLRAIGSGVPTGFTQHCRAGGIDAICENQKFAWQYFPARIARSPVAFAFPAEKEQESYRIFLIGGSAAQGDPDPAHGIAPLLRVMLEDRYPGVRFEVVNAAVTAINSHVVLPIARDLAGRDGDLFVVYLGNNEVVGPFGAGTVFSPLSSSLLAIRSSVRARSTRLGQLWTRWSEAGDKARSPAEWRGMAHFLGHQVRLDDPRMQSVYSHFRENLVDIVGVAGDSGAEVVLSTVGTNLANSAPFASLHRRDLSDTEAAAWDRHYSEGIAAEADGRFAEAFRAYGEAERIDPAHADLLFRIGNVLLARGEFESARSRLLQARDRDALRFRADSRINEIIRSVATESPAGAVHLFDAERALEEDSAHGIPGADMFHDHVHLTFEGNHVVARGLVSVVERALPEWVTRRRADRPALDVNECARRLAFTSFDRHRVSNDMLKRLGQPPFTGQSNHAQQVERVRKEISSLRRHATPEGWAEATRLYREAIGETEDDPWLRFGFGVLLREQGEFQAATEEFRRFLYHLPQDLQGREKLSSTLAEQGQFEEALSECRRLIAQAPHFPTPYYTMAYALARTDRLDESIATYRRLLDIDPSSRDEIYNEIGRIQIRRELYDEAVETYREAIRRHEQSGGEPNPDLYFNFGFALKRAGISSEAVRAFEQAADRYREALTENPTATSHLALGSIFVELGDYESASREFVRAVALNPADFGGHYNLVGALVTLGRREDAEAAVRHGVRTLRDAGRAEEARRLREFLDRMRGDLQPTPPGHP